MCFMFLYKLKNQYKMTFKFQENNDDLDERCVILYERIYKIGRN